MSLIEYEELDPDDQHKLVDLKLLKLEADHLQRQLESAEIEAQIGVLREAKKALPETSADYEPPTMAELNRRLSASRLTLPR